MANSGHEWRRSRQHPLIVAIGASEGGVPALQEFFHHLPGNLGAAFVVVAHLDPEYRSELPSILSGRTRMPVVQVTDRENLQADHVYVVPPDCRLQVADKGISAAPLDEADDSRSPIDSFFSSVAENLGDSFAVILSGAGSDGAIGVRAVRKAGGIILVQDPEEAEHASMPRSAIATGLADFILPVQQLAGRLVELARLKQSNQFANVADLERQLQQQRRLLALSHDPIFMWELEGGIVEWNRGCEELYGYTRQEAIGRRKHELLGTVVPGSSFDRLKQELLKERSWSGELRHRTKGGRELTVEARIDLETTEGRQLVLESTHDVTDRKTFEERQQLLLTELTHRVKNLLAVIQAIARQTQRTTPSPEEFIEKFGGRLAAMAEAHGLLVDSDWKGADLAALARVQLQAHVASDGDRVHIEGPAVLLSPDVATPFGLVLHELGTNAAKYGALSRREGTVSLTWAVEQGNGHQLLRATWKEVGGPTPQVPTGRGLGSDLIEKAIPGATVAREFKPEGLVCSIEIVLTEASQLRGGDGSA